MIEASKLEYFTLAAWLRGLAEGLNRDDDVSPVIIAKLNRAAQMLDYVFFSEIENGGNEDDFIQKREENWSPFGIEE